MSMVNEPIIKDLTVAMRTAPPTTDTEVYTVKVGSVSLPKGFYEMKPHVQRVWVESMELGARIVNLEGFLEQEELVAEHCSDEMVSLMTEQLAQMKQLNATLRQRLKLEDAL